MPAGKVGGVIASAPLMVMERLPVVVLKPRESVTFMENVAVPAAVGVPLIIPVPELMAKEAGNDPEATAKV